MATYEQAYDIQTYVESSSMAILSNAGIANAYDSRGGSVEITPRVECAFKLGPAGTHVQIVNDICLYDTYAGSLSLTVVTDREVTKGSHASYQRKVLNAFKDKEVYNSGSFAMPFHQVQSLILTGILPTVGADNNLDLSGITYDMRICVNATAWPTS